VTIAVVVLAAGGSRRLGRPKQLLGYRGATLLDAVLATARQLPAEQLVVTVGAAAAAIREHVDLSGVELAPTPDFGEGCAASIRSALDRIRPGVSGLVLLLGDQPDVSGRAAERLCAEAGDAAMGVCRYDDGRGHPLWFHRRMFGALRAMHGDKAVWKLLEAADSRDLVEVRVPGRVPLDVNTWEDYEALLARDREEVR
jgi:molybdenum cofactor cytidylyltransferase